MALSMNLAPSRTRSITQDAHLIEAVVQGVSQQVVPDALANLGARDVSAVAATTQPGHLAFTDPRQLGHGLLDRMHAKGAQKAGQAHKPGPGLAETQQQVPIQRKLKALI